jgi:uncharacterized protein YdaU (DUF1376 family)
MYWGDYARDTGHLNATGHGAYLMLIKHYWCTGQPLNDDDDELWRIACCDSKKEWLALRPKIIRLFQCEAGVLRHKRVDQELAKALCNIKAKVEAGKKGAERRWQKDGIPNGTPNGSAIAEPSISHRQIDAPSPSPSQPEPSVSDPSLRSGSSTSAGAPSSLKASEREKPPGTVGLDSTLEIPLAMLRPPNGDWRALLFGQCLDWLAKLEGKPPGKLRALMGRWLKSAEDDAQRVVNLIGACQSEKRADPVSWVEASLKRGHDPGLPAGVKIGEGGRWCCKFSGRPLTDPEIAELRAKAG